MVSYLVGHVGFVVVINPCSNHRNIGRLLWFLFAHFPSCFWTHGRLTNILILSSIFHVVNTTAWNTTAIYRDQTWKQRMVGSKVRMSWHLGFFIHLSTVIYIPHIELQFVIDNICKQTEFILVLQEQWTPVSGAMLLSRHFRAWKLTNCNRIFRRHSGSGAANCHCFFKDSGWEDKPVSII